MQKQYQKRKHLKTSTRREAQEKQGIRRGNLAQHKRLQHILTHPNSMYPPGVKMFSIVLMLTNSEQATKKTMVEREQIWSKMDTWWQLRIHTGLAAAEEVRCATHTPSARCCGNMTHELFTKTAPAKYHIHSRPSICKSLTQNQVKKKNEKILDNQKFRLFQHLQQFQVIQQDTKLYHALSCSSIQYDTISN